MEIVVRITFDNNRPLFLYTCDANIRYCISAAAHTHGYAHDAHCVRTHSIEVERMHNFWNAFGHWEWINVEYSIVTGGAAVATAAIATAMPMYHKYESGWDIAMAQ